MPIGRGSVYAARPPFEPGSTMRAMVLMLLLLLRSISLVAFADDVVVATVDEHPITVDDLVPVLRRTAPSTPGPDVPLETREQALEQAIADRLLFDEAMRRGLDTDPKVQAILVQILMGQQRESWRADLDTSDAALRAHYEANREVFTIPKKVRARRILVSTANRSPREARRLLKRVRKEVAADPDRFAALAEQHSEGPYRDRGGDLGMLTRDGRPGVPAEVVEVAFSLEPGGLSKVLPTDDGYELVLVLDVREEVVRTFEQMKGAVRRHLLAEAERNRYRAYVQSLRPEGSIAAAERYAGLHVEGYTLEEADLPEGVAFRVGAVDVTAAELDAAMARLRTSSEAEAAADQLDQAVLAGEARREGALDHAKTRNAVTYALLQTHVYSQVRTEDFTEEVLRAHFDEHRDQFRVPEKRQIHHILVPMDNTDPDEARRLMQDIRQQVLEDPMRFAPLAHAHSASPYKRRGGDLGYVAREGKPGVPDEVVEVAFALEPDGQLSAVIEADGGLHLVMVTDRRDPIERTFRQVRGAVLRRVKAEAHKARYAAFVEALRSKARVTVDEEALAGATLRWQEVRQAPPQ